MKKTFRVFIAAVMLCAPAAFAAKKEALKVEDVPTFQVRFRVTAVENQTPAAEQKFTFRFGIPWISPYMSAEATGNA